MTRPRSPRRTPRLSDGIITLDRHGLNDTEEHLAGEDDEHFYRFRMPASTALSVRRAILRWQRQWRVGGRTRAFAIRMDTSGQLVGGCELRLGRNRDAEVSYWIFTPFRGRGFASRAVRLLCPWAFTALGLETIVARVEIDNMASRKVVRAAGFIEAGEELMPEGFRAMKYRLTR